MIVTPIQLFLVRHGTDTSEALQKFGDERLTTQGLEQAEQLGHMLRGHNITLLYTSPAKAAIETAQIIEDHTEISQVVDQRLRSRDLGEVDGLTYNQVTQRYASLLQKQRFDKSWGFPGGENNGQIFERTTAFAKDLLQISSGRREKIAVITHNMVINFLIYNLQGLNYQSKMFYLLDGGSFAVLERSARSFGMKYLGSV